MLVTVCILLWVRMHSMYLSPENSYKQCLLLHICPLTHMLCTNALSSFFLLPYGLSWNPPVPKTDLFSASCNYSKLHIVLSFLLLFFIVPRLDSLKIPTLAKLLVSQHRT